MKYNELTTKKKRSLKRVGRGIAAGQGKTAGRGTKGQKSRAGSTRRLGFEGGQNPLMQRLPKLRGFNSHYRSAIVLSTTQLESLNKTVIDNQTIVEAGLAPNLHAPVKVINGGEVKKKLTVKLQLASSSAIKQIEGAGGSFVKTKQTPKSKQTKQTKA